MLEVIVPRCRNLCSLMVLVAKISHFRRFLSNVEECDLSITFFHQNLQKQKGFKSSIMIMVISKFNNKHAKLVL